MLALLINLFRKNLVVDIMKFLSDFPYGFGIGIKIKLSKPILSTLYQNQFIFVHSNIAHEDTYPLNSDYLTKDGRVEKNSSDIEDESKIISDFTMVANNYYTPNFLILQISLYKK
jgi:hypothetical protein